MDKLGGLMRRTDHAVLPETIGSNRWEARPLAASGRIGRKRRLRWGYVGTCGPQAFPGALAEGKSPNRWSRWKRHGAHKNGCSRGQREKGNKLHGDVGLESFESSQCHGQSIVPSLAIVELFIGLLAPSVDRFAWPTEQYLQSLKSCLVACSCDPRL